MIDFLSVLQAFFISAGVGASTLAVANFYVAIWDGKIDPNERRMMGVVYVALRIVMVSILLTTLALTITKYTSALPIISFDYIVWTILAILFTNAILMTYHCLPSAFGPAIQASAWYTMGILATIRLVGWELTYTQFIFMYLFMVFLAVTIMNLLMIHCKNCQERNVCDVNQA